ncbi:Regulator of rDNA transcription protein 15 [Senna tora]|uniref:Regulator of rDNA transcription protein 15 n=1 Tax=Senna tora TaxID=362788 RepID=A0A834TG65_9FABA|nr:Regulator of rDNA transcription protein 15 [Senna tora]
MDVRFCGRFARAREKTCTSDRFDTWDLEDESKRRGLNLSGSWQQGHFATNNTPSHISIVQKGFYPPLNGNLFKGSLAAHPSHGVHQRQAPLGDEAPTADRQTDGGRTHRF